MTKFQIIWFLTVLYSSEFIVGSLFYRYRKQNRERYLGKVRFLTRHLGWHSFCEKILRDNKLIRKKIYYTNYLDEFSFVLLNSFESFLHVQLSLEIAKVILTCPKTSAEKWGGGSIGKAIGSLARYSIPQFEADKKPLTAFFYLNLRLYFLRTWWETFYYRYNFSVFKLAQASSL